MDGDGSNVVGVGVELMNAFQRVVVEHAYFHVVGTRQHPMLSSHELGGANRQIAHFERLGNLLGVERRDTAVNAGQSCPMPISSTPCTMVDNS